MDLIEALQARHSVRQFTDERIEGEVLDQLTSYIEECNIASGLNIQLCLDETKAFSGIMSKQFKRAYNYLAIVGKRGPGLEEAGGYYGQKIVLRAQQLGLNTCWVAMTYSKSKSDIVVDAGEKIVIVIAIGYGETQGEASDSKATEDVSNIDAKSPIWFEKGVVAALLAPTAMNQQKFFFELDGNKVHTSIGIGFYTKVDLGIAKCNFEIGAGAGDWKWA